MKKGLQGRWTQVLRDFFFVILLVCTLRWALGEPFLVPSGSMIPTLLVKDYILVSKYSYGLRIPFTKKWIWGPQLPQRGDVVVFRAKEDNYYFMVKRVVGLPGDTVTVADSGDRLLINGQPQKQVAQDQKDDEGIILWTETLGNVDHTVRYDRETESFEDSPRREFIVPEGHLFLMGDNRDRSSDSRVWGTLPVENLLGKAQWIWMSCKEEAPAASVFCLGEDMRADRVFTKIR